MTIIQGITLLFIYVGLVFIIGIIKFNNKIKQKILIILSSIYNCFIGFTDTLTFVLLFGFLTNRSNGSGYSVPDSEASMNFLFGMIILTYYLILLLPLNIFMKKKSEITLKAYLKTNAIATIVGFAIYWGYWFFFDRRRLF